MKDTISREAAINAADRADYPGLAIEDVKKVTDEVIKEIKKLPSFERVGKWIEVENKWGGLEIRCSECGAQVPRDAWGNAMQCAYCPNCGATMMKGEGDGVHQ